MQVLIKINCEDEADLLSHLTKIRQEIKKEIKKGEITDSCLIEDENCYGDHEIKIIAD